MLNALQTAFKDPNAQAVYLLSDGVAISLSVLI